MLNLAKNQVDIFLFEFVCEYSGITFRLNKAIIKDMPPDIREKVIPLINQTSKVLLNSSHFSDGDVVVDGHIVAGNRIEVSLSEKARINFVDMDKKMLLDNALAIVKILIDLMDRNAPPRITQ